MRNWGASHCGFSLDMAAVNIPLRTLYVALCIPMIILFHSLTRFYAVEKRKALAIKNKEEIHRRLSMDASNNNNPLSTDEDKKEIPLQGRKLAVCAENNHPGNGVEAEGKTIDKEIAEMNARLVIEYASFLSVICKYFNF